MRVGPSTGYPAPPMDAIQPPPRPPAEPAHLGWRLLAMLYDSLPVIALWFVVGALALLIRGGEPVTPWSAAFWLQNLALWAVTGLYLVHSWHHGGQTLGMRPWRLQVVDEDGRPPTLTMLWTRYAWATLSLALFGVGLLWSLVEGQRRSWHDLASATRLVRLAARPAAAKGK
jgi:uncharacterized RDD family membrane protein YckC